MIYLVCQNRKILSFVYGILCIEEGVIAAQLSFSDIVTIKFGMA